MTRQPTRRQRLASALAAGALALTAGLATAQPASAAEYWGAAHKPKRFVCAVFQVCDVVRHCSWGDPNKAATKPADARKKYCHNDRY